MTEDEIEAIGKRTKPNSDQAKLLAALVWALAELKHERVVNVAMEKQLASIYGKWPVIV